LAAPLLQDGNPGAFSASELAAILAIFRGVAEDYAPFDVDITTEEPVGAPLNTWSRVAIGGVCAEFGMCAGFPGPPNCRSLPKPL
jgi:hypothetical protein